VQTTIIPFLGKGGKPEQYIAIRTDITQLVAQRRTILEQYKKLREDDTKKDEFASMITHELKSPLASILGWCSALKKNQMLGELTPQQINAIEKQTKIKKSKCQIKTK